MRNLQKIFRSNYLSAFDVRGEIFLNLFSVYRVVIYDISKT